MSDRHVMGTVGLYTKGEYGPGWMAQCSRCVRRVFMPIGGGKQIVDRGEWRGGHVWSSPGLKLDAALGVVNDQ